MPKATFYTRRPPGRLCLPPDCARHTRWRADFGVVGFCAAVQQLDVDFGSKFPKSFIPHEVWLPTDPMPSETPVLLTFGNALPNICKIERF